MAENYDYKRRNGGSSVNEEFGDCPLTTTSGIEIKRVFYVSNSFRWLSPNRIITLKHSQNALWLLNWISRTHTFKPETRSPPLSPYMAYRQNLPGSFATSLQLWGMNPTCCPSLDFAVWSGCSWQRGEVEGENKRERGWDRYRKLSTGQWVFSHHSNLSADARAIHFSRSHRVTIERRNEWCYLLSDVISLIRLILRACVPPLIRKPRDFHSSARGFLLSQVQLLRKFWR